MNVNFKLTPEAIASIHLRTKHDVLQHVAALFRRAYGIEPHSALAALEEREKLGSTGFGRAIAIPHARLAEVRRPVAVLLRLETPVDFKAADGMPVDLVFGLLSPENAGATHLHALAAISRLVRDDRGHQAFTEAPDEEALFALLSNQFERDAA